MIKRNIKNQQTQQLKSGSILQNYSLELNIYQTFRDQN
jgi:hypothetical protein